MKIYGGYQPTFQTFSKEIKGNNNDDLYLEAAKNGLDKNSNIWDEIAKDSNIRNASFEELCNISTQLYEAEEISLLTHSTLTFDPGRCTLLTRSDINLTPTDEDGRRNWIAEYQARANRDLKMGNVDGYVQNNDILKILNRLI
ncbi:hypothetical protein [Alkaliphilus crotonatoxidans]